ncbi:Homeodomain-like DNA binding domain-containing transcription factor [Phycomyces blakesleeanus NRRL 1555(-)]|uniref:Homeodomain-like DNA binding domain-containing transcription factor n=1 Tax=Phycomyces blakesleeanus (strain ATCC 8743b / DSM 1359 / FGSC 10004 / NBRC 33097 / NRRL 1555) TaxID=763407 RepID=A0A162NIC4_PHYB8|nr:Homeodomain-like DNA binding domain-containing transcription factor [Phycomyces blakesleeanus NRRL 1555(-)]OAD69954.1 Homeodomain-like DNA binding domain-containing transcription factor [Phycomyces blakesleeanus NRRL 1555(-)]|eukprot:XP_018287994.1 Homeodomain-like DNA binding domain-containing transcription factor [Phycomyces blakesleeanus NRRL 1555(-)]
MCIPRTTINTTIKRWEETGTAKLKTRPRGPKKLSVTDVISFCLSVMNNPFESYAYHQRNMTAAGAASAKGFSSYTPFPKPNLTREQKKSRLRWTKARANFGIEGWSRVVLSDESSFMLKGNGSDPAAIRHYVYIPRRRY